MFYQNGFQKGHRAQHKLIFMIEKFWKIRDNKGAFAAVLTDLSQASEFIWHDSLIPKINACDFDEKSQQFIFAYLSNRK